MIRQLVLAPIIEPVSNPDPVRALDEAGLSPPSYATVKRHMAKYVKQAWRQELAAACGARGAWPASLVLYNARTLYYKTRGLGTGSASRGSP